MRKTLTVGIGNSDNKLTQQEWSEFCKEVGHLVSEMATAVYFAGASLPFETWQNAAWVCEFHDVRQIVFMDALRELAGKYRQDSIALTIGDTILLVPFPTSEEQANAKRNQDRIGVNLDSGRPKAKD